MCFPEMEAELTKLMIRAMIAEQNGKNLKERLEDLSEKQEENINSSP